MALTWSKWRPICNKIVGLFIAAKMEIMSRLAGVVSDSCLAALLCRVINEDHLKNGSQV